MKKIYGDLIKLAQEGKFDVICHGCNCFTCMGGGIAKSIRETWPEAYEVDKQTVYGDRLKLGQISIAKVRNKVNKPLFIVNAYTQYDYGIEERKTNYDAIRSCFSTIKKRFCDLRIGYPMIGAGLGGGDWGIISEIINEELEGCNHTLVIWKK